MHMLRERMLKLYARRYALWDMGLKQFKARYAASALGIVWAAVNPLLLMSVIAFIFTSVFRVEMKHFAFFVLAGLIPWMFFSRAVSDAAASIVSQPGLLRQFNLPPEIIPLSAVLSDFLTFLVALAATCPVFVFLNPGVAAVLPGGFLIILCTLLFTCGAGLLVSAANVFARDTAHFLEAVLMLWFWATPVFYSVEMVPSFVRWVYAINPMAAFIATYRDILFYGRLPPLKMWFCIAAWASLSAACGVCVFLLSEERMAKQL